MQIFKTYTGNALLNNALMTIEALAGLNNVSEITAEVLLNLFEKKRLAKLNQRLKSYTMLFTKNGPLHNDKEFGERVYKNLMLTILHNIEVEGNVVCELSGLSYQTSFETHFANALKTAGYPLEKIKGKDKTINRCWFPLIGGLGSDAQALPQAKFAINIHPVFVAIMQFLPLSAVIFKGGILLVDSINFEFAREFVSDNVKRVKEKIEVTKSDDQIENIKDYAKGNYLLTALKILHDKRDYEDEYSDLNLWSFSNSGTGASCEIDRVPNDLFKKLRILKNNPECETELIKILADNKYSSYFLERLEGNLDYPFLYPFKNNDGVSIAFFESYQKVIGNSKFLSYAKYIAYLIDKYKTKSFEKILPKSGAYEEDEYRVSFFTVLLLAASNGEWSIKHHISILNDPEFLPVQNKTWKIHKMVHYYYLSGRENWSEVAPIPTYISPSYNVCLFLANLIELDDKTNSLKKNLTNAQDYQDVNLFPLLTRWTDKLDLSTVERIMFKEGKQDKYGLLELLRLYFVQTEGSEQVEISDFEIVKNNFWNKYLDFAEDYQEYYFDKYKDKNTDKLPKTKFNKSVLESFPIDNENFIRWFYDTLEKRNQYKKEQNKIDWKEWDDELLYNQIGERVISIARFAIQFSLIKNFKEFKQPQSV